jgi:hypothetical protein
MARFTKHMIIGDNYARNCENAFFIHTHRVNDGLVAVCQNANSSIYYVDLFAVNNKLIIILFLIKN